jgi:hypothetical protein
MLIYTAMKKTATIYPSHNKAALGVIYTHNEAAYSTLMLHDEGSPEVPFRTSIVLSPARLVR